MKDPPPFVCAEPACVEQYFARRQRMNRIVKLGSKGEVSIGEPSASAVRARDELALRSNTLSTR
jgi:hypothetical protein